MYWDNHMKVTNGLLLERINDFLMVYEPKQQKKIQVNLHKPWNYFPFSEVNYLTPIRIINSFYISEKEYETTPDTLILLNPDILINSRTIAEASACPRRVFLEFITGESKITLPMVRGSIIHDAFTNIVSQEVSVSNAIKIALEKFAFTLSYLSVDLKDLIIDITPVLRGLAQSAPTLQDNQVLPEMTFLSPLFGLMGRLDYWSNKELYELKTSRKIPSKKINTWFSDLMQTVTYMHGLSPTPKAVPRSAVIYSGEGTPIFRQTNLNLDLLQRIHMARNYAYIVQFEGYIPPDTSKKICSSCFKQEACSNFSMIFHGPNIQSKAFQYLNHFLSLVRLEHLKNRQEFAFLWKLSPQGRVKTGKAIRKIKMYQKKEEKYHYECNNSSELRPGELVILSQGDPVLDNTNIATITSIDRTSISLSSQHNLPEEAFLDGYSSDFTFRRLNKNLYDLTFGQKSQHKSHKLIIYGEKPTFSSRKLATLEDLDQSQYEAIQLAVNANDYCLIQGPAGTGKTYTIAKLIGILRKEGQRILLTAYTNTAVDNIIRLYLRTTKEQNAQKEIVRLGIEQAIDPDMVELLMQHKKLSYQQLLKTPIVAATTSTIARGIYDEISFDTVIVDEASQMTEVSVLAAITKGQRFILVGDDKQLPPLVQSFQAEKLGFGTSLFKRLRRVHPEASTLLRYQYRMHSNLMDFSNRSYYDNSVQAATADIGKQLLWDLINVEAEEPISNPFFQSILDPNQPLVYVEVPSTFDRKRRVNKQEAEIVNSLVQYYLKMGLSPDHIGIIAPFRGQVAEINRYLGINSGISVDTIDRFQGSDNELIFLSLCTLSRPHILEDERRLNVALTRGKKKLIIIGDTPTEQSLFKDLHSFIQRNYSLVRLDSSKLAQEERMVSPKELSIETDISYQSLAEEDINKEFSIKIEHSNICVLCQERVREESILRCPICKQGYHKEHIQDWLLNQDVCATCQSRIQLSSD